MLPTSLPRLPALPKPVLPEPVSSEPVSSEPVLSGPVPSGPALAAPHLAGGAVVAQRAPLRIGYTPLGLHRHLPCLLRRLRQVEPGLRPRLVELTPAETLEALEQGRLDLGVVPQPACASPALRLLPLPAEPLLAALPAAEPGPVTLAGLARQGLVLFPPTQAPMLHARILQAFAAAGVALPPPREAKRASAVLALVAAGQGAALLPATAAQQRCPGVRLARIADGAGLPRMSMALALPRRRLDAPMQRLLALLPTL